MFVLEISKTFSLCDIKGYAFNDKQTKFGFWSGKHVYGVMEFGGEVLRKHENLYSYVLVGGEGE